MRNLAVRHWLPLITVLSCLLPRVAVSTPAQQGVDAPADARAWLVRIHTAANQRNYQGTMVFTAGGMLSSSRVAHFNVGGQSFERLEALDGRMQRIYRHNDAVHTLWSQSRVAIIETRNVATQMGSLTKVAEPRAAEQYELKAEGSERVAGRDAMVLLLRPRDDLRYPQRVWADRATGLMLRADVIGPAKAVLESAAFSQIEIGVRPQPDTVLGPMSRLDGYRVLRPQQLATQLEAEGWAMVRSVPGFILAGCLKRPLDVTGRQPAGGRTGSAGGVLRRADARVAVHRTLRRQPPQGRPAGPDRRHRDDDLAPRRLLDHRARRSADGHAEAVQRSAGPQALTRCAARAAPQIPPHHNTPESKACSLLFKRFPGAGWHAWRWCCSPRSPSVRRCSRCRWPRRP
jgi:sigma-E factor negative regulatory protein RseB